MAAVRLLTAAGALRPTAASCAKGSGELLLYVRLLGETAPVEVPAMGSVADLAEAAREVFSGRGVKMDARPVLRYGGEVLTDHSALLADVGVCSESVVDADGRGKPTAHNVRVVRVSGMRVGADTGDLSGLYDRAECTADDLRKTVFWKRDVPDPRKCPAIYAALVDKPQTGEVERVLRWRLYYGKREPGDRTVYRSGWWPSSAELLGQWDASECKKYSDAMVPGAPYPLVEPVEW
eukprot:TRINITY_DN700_c0_g1_i6.p1 TRINITY_DN700_c0_g1~~TRINITY_DN700_c0_g1_i6.p1  ORF type:complete len:256 (+),score=63.53 TRINITY_DN700_c0_g1_i6:63-770(+)